MGYSQYIARCHHLRGIACFAKLFGITAGATSNSGIISTVIKWVGLREQRRQNELRRLRVGNGPNGATSVSQARKIGRNVSRALNIRDHIVSKGIDYKKYAVLLHCIPVGPFGPVRPPKTNNGPANRPALKSVLVYFRSTGIGALPRCRPHRVHQMNNQVHTMNKTVWRVLFGTLPLGVPLIFPRMLASLNAANATTN